MRRSIGQALIRRRSVARNISPIPALIIFPSLQPPSKWTNPAQFIYSKFFSSASPYEHEVGHRTNFDTNLRSNSQEVGASLVDLVESEASPILYGGGVDEKEAGLGECKESFDGDATLSADEITEEAEAEISEVNPKQLESVLFILQGTIPQEIGPCLDKLEELQLSEGFVVRVFQHAGVSGECLVSFFKWAIKKDESVKSSRALGILVDKISANDEISKMEAYLLWDLVRELGKMKGLVNTEILNQLISIFFRLGKAKASLEVFNLFDELGCTPNEQTFYITIVSLGKKFMVDSAWLVCEKMLNSRNLPDAKKNGKIITLLCRGKKAKEAYSIYLLAKEHNFFPGQDALSSLIGALCRDDDSVCLAFELLEDYPKESIRYQNRAFSLVVKHLARTNDMQSAKLLLLKMADSGPPPGNSAFNYVITGLCKEGEVEDAISLTKVMNRRGLRPDGYTYSVIMSGYAKVGLMDEAFKIFCEAKKKHKTLTPVAYHILIRGYCKIDDYEKALEIFKEMKDDKVKPNVDEYNKLIRTLCMKAIDWHTAEKLLDEMKESGMLVRGSISSLVASVKILEEELADEFKLES